EPWRLGADEDVPARADRRIVQKRPKGDVDEGAVAHHGVEQRAAPLAMRVMAGVVAVDQEAVRTPGDGELLAFDAGERPGRRTGRPPAVRTVAVHGVKEGIGYRVVDGAAKALSREHAIGVRHRFLLSGSLAAASPTDQTSRMTSGLLEDASFNQSPDF